MDNEESRPTPIVVIESWFLSQVGGAYLSNTALTSGNEKNIFEAFLKPPPKRKQIKNKLVRN